MLSQEKETDPGIVVSYDIIKNINGTLSVESETGKGTVFTNTPPYKDRLLINSSENIPQIIKGSNLLIPYAI